MALFWTTITSPIGNLRAIASEDFLSLLEFEDSKELSAKIEKITAISREKIKETENRILLQTKTELSEYFEGKRKHFEIPLQPLGTEFQKHAWDALSKIPFWETRNYLEEATMIGNPKAVRAIGGANHQNPIVIIIPCHRVIGKSGKLVGYGGGLNRKEWLLSHEQR